MKNIRNGLTYIEIGVKQDGKGHRLVFDNLEAEMM